MATNGGVAMLHKKTEQLFRFEFAAPKMCDGGIYSRRFHLKHESSKYYGLYNIGDYDSSILLTMIILIQCCGLKNEFLS